MHCAYAVADDLEAFCAFLAVATHKLCQPRQESLFERNAAG